MPDLIAKGDNMAQLTMEVRHTLELGGMDVGFTLTTPEYGEFDAYVADGTKVTIRVEPGR